MIIDWERGGKTNGKRLYYKSETVIILFEIDYNIWERRGAGERDVRQACKTRKQAGVRESEKARTRQAAREARTRRRDEGKLGKKNKTRGAPQQK